MLQTDRRPAPADGATEAPGGGAGALTILVTGEPVAAVEEVAGSFDRMVRSVVEPHWRGAIATLDARTSELAPPDELAAIVVTGSPESVTTRAAWMERAAGWLRRAVEHQVPVLGLCFGHQLLAHALGGRVTRNPRGMEVGTVEAECLLADPLFEVDATPLLVNMIHEDCVAELPPGAAVLARTARDPHAAIRFAPHAWGVQFHPEFDGAVLRAYLAAYREAFTALGLDVTALTATARDAPRCRGVLERFVQRVVSGAAAGGPRP